MSNRGDVSSESGKTPNQGISRKSTGSVSYIFLISGLSLETYQTNLRFYQFSGPDFSNLMEQKRPNDQGSRNRRESISDQYNSGFVGRMWSRYVVFQSAMSTITLSQDSILIN